MFTELDHHEVDLDLERLRRADVGTVVLLRCRVCESLEYHEKLYDGTWYCLCCGVSLVKL